MKAVYYHADSHLAWGGKPPVGAYEAMARKFLAQCHEAGMRVVHLTCEGQPGWGDENHFYPLDPKNVVANREEAFTEFLSKAPEDWYWFTEPDSVILEGLPKPIKADLLLAYRRGDDVPINPSWRMATPQALPFFEAVRDEIRKDHRKDWHGDSAAFTKVWRQMGQPSERLQWNGIRVDFVPFSEVVKPGRYTKNMMGPKKFK